MPITSIRRDWGVDPSIVRITTTDDLDTIESPGYMSSQPSVLDATGGFEFIEGDIVAINYSNGEAFFTYSIELDQFVTQVPAASPHKYFLGAGSVFSTIDGSWIMTRNNAGDYVYRGTTANNTILAIDFSGALNSRVSTGFKITGLTYVYAIGLADLDFHTIELYKTAYTDNQVLTTTLVPLVGGGSNLNLTPRPNVYVQEIELVDPLLDTSDAATYVLEISMNSLLGGRLDFYGINVNYEVNN